MENLNFGAIPSMNWESESLEQSWKTFKNHVKFVFSGPLKDKSEEEKCSYINDLGWRERKRNIFDLESNRGSTESN